MSTPESPRSHTPAQLKSQPTSSHAKPAQAHPCLLCQQRKVKCDRKAPCSNCQKSRVDCIAVVPIGPKQRKRRFPEAELLARLRRYERLLQEHGVDVEKVNADIDKQISEGVLGRKSGERSGFKKHITKSEFFQAPESPSCSGQTDEFRDTEAILRGSSEDEAAESPIMSSYDKWFAADGLDLFFGQSHGSGNLKPFHPPPAQIFRLWQTFLDNVNPLIKIFHAPSVQQQILEASGDLSNVPKGLEALMFAIYYFAVTSLAPQDCLSMFGMERSALLTKYQHGVRQALVNTSCLKTSDMVVLQALTLYLTSAIHMIDPRSLFCLTGISVRIAQRIGLDQDGAGHGISPFDVEMRRRLWWHIAVLDYRVGELSGATSSILSQSWTTKFPLNVNDSDLYPEMREPPQEYQGATEMLFALLRCELGQFFRPSTTPATQATIKQYKSKLQEKYLRHCDPRIPLHLISMLVAKSQMCKLHLVSQHPRVYPNKSASLSQAEKDSLFISSVEMLEYHNKMLSSRETQRYLWYINKSFPFPAHMYILCELRTRTVDALADRAWQQITESIDGRTEHMSHRQESPLHTALSNLTIKAWDARESALLKRQPQVTPPVTILRLRESSQAKKQLNATTSSSTETEVYPDPKKFPDVERHFAAVHKTFGPDTADPNPKAESSHAGEIALVEYGKPAREASPAAEMNPGVDGNTAEEIVASDGSGNMNFSTMDWDYWNPMMPEFDVEGLAGGQNTFDNIWPLG